MTLEELEALRAKATLGMFAPFADDETEEYVVALVNEAPALLEELRLAREVVKAAREMFHAGAYRQWKDLGNALLDYDSLGVKSGEEAK